MTGRDKKIPRRLRAVSLLALGLVVGIAMMATPASGHISGSVLHVANHMKNFFYTKTQSNNRFVNAIPGTNKAGSAVTADRLGQLDRNVSAAFNNPAGAQTFGSVACDAGMVAIGGGVSTSSISTLVNVNGSWPNSTTSWGAWVNNTSGGGNTFNVYVVCARALTFTSAATPRTKS